MLGNERRFLHAVKPDISGDLCSIPITKKPRDRLIGRRSFVTRTFQVQPRRKKKTSNRGMGIPISQRSAHPILPDSIFSLRRVFMIELYFLEGFTALVGSASLLSSASTLLLVIASAVSAALAPFSSSRISERSAAASLLPSIPAHSCKQP